MRTALRYLVMALLGIVAGLAFAVHTVRAGALGSTVTVGPWSTGADFGTAGASAKTRAVVALRGLLALPAREARYYNAAVDDAGRPLDGHCRYRVTGGPLPARWWSVTMYDGDGYLVANAPGIFSVESASLTPAEQRAWTIAVAPEPQPGHWLPTGGLDRFELTLRTYLPDDRGRGNPPRAVLPRIERASC